VAQSVSEKEQRATEDSIVTANIQKTWGNRTTSLDELAEAAVSMAQVTSDKRKVIALLQDLFGEGTESEKNVLAMLMQRYLDTKNAQCEPK